MPDTFRIFISAGEASGDTYGALLIDAISKRLGPADFFGCGGNRMRAAGCETIVDARDISMVGLVEVLPGLARAWRALQSLLNAAREQPPDLAILIDFPDFNLRIAKELKRLGVPVLYFVAPQVWAWRRSRLKLLRRDVDRLLCIFPFEERYFRQAGVDADFVGHPLAGRVVPTLSATEFRERCSIPQSLPLIALLPGSRRKEIQLNLPPILESARRLAAWREFGFVVPVASGISSDWIRTFTARSGLSLFVTEGLTHDVLAHAEAAIVASGTAAVEAALAQTPMVIVYRVSAASWLLGRWLVQVPFYSMVNIVANHPIVPEFVQGRFRPETVAREMQQLLEVPALAARMRESYIAFADKLRPPQRPVSLGASHEPADAIERAAAIAEVMLKKSRTRRAVPVASAAKG